MDGAATVLVLIIIAGLACAGGLLYVMYKTQVKHDAALATLGDQVSSTRSSLSTKLSQTNSFVTDMQAKFDRDTQDAAQGLKTLTTSTKAGAAQVAQLQTSTKAGAVQVAQLDNDVADVISQVKDDAASQIGKLETGLAAASAKADAALAPRDKVYAKTAFVDWLDAGNADPGREPNAGKLGYKKFSDGLDIVGAGNKGQRRKVRVWDDLYTDKVILGGSWTVGAAGQKLQVSAGAKELLSLDPAAGTRVGGTLSADKVQLGSKWVLSGVGDKHANDDWLRLFGKDGAGYYGGLAADKLFAGKEAHFPGGITNMAGKVQMPANGSGLRWGNSSSDVFDDGSSLALVSQKNVRLRTAGKDRLTIDSNGTVQLNGVLKVCDANGQACRVL